METEAKFIISGSVDKEIRIWCMETERSINQINVGQTVQCLKVLNENELIVGLGKGGLRVYNLETKKHITTQKAECHNLAVNWIEILKNTQIATASNDCTIKIWSKFSENLACARTLEGHTGGVRCMKSFLDKIISCSADKTIKIWKFETGECLKTLEGHMSAVCSIDFKDNKILSGSEDCTIKIWDIGLSDCEQTLKGHSHIVESVAFMDLKKIISGSSDRLIKLWDIEKGNCLRTFSGHEEIIAIKIISENKVASCSQDSLIKIWDTENGKCLTTFKGHVNRVNCLDLLQKNF